MKNRSLDQKKSSLLVSGLRGASPAWYCSTLAKNQPLCCVLPSEQMVQDFEQDLQLFTNAHVIGYPGYEIPPYTPLSPDQRTTAARLSALYRLTESREPFILAISIEALLRRVMDRSVLLKHAELLMEGEECDLHSLKINLINMGYEHVSLVKSIGDFSVRGGIVDIFPPSFLLPDAQLHEGPIRLDFFGDTVESIRAFDPFTQRSSTHISETILLPVSDIYIPTDNLSYLRKARDRFHQYSERFNWSAEITAELTERIKSGQRFAGIEFFLPLLSVNDKSRSATIFDYLPQDTLFVLQDTQAINQQSQITWERIKANYQTALLDGKPALPTDELFIGEEAFVDSLTSFNRVELTEFVPEHAEHQIIQTNNHQLLKQEISMLRKKEGLLSPLVKQASNWLGEGDNVIICCRSERRQKTLAELLGRFNIPLASLEAPVNISELPPLSGQRPLYLSDTPLSSGFSLPLHRLHLLSENELFGEMRIGSRKKKARRPKGTPVNFTELTSGDVVVHREHGLGLYRGLETIELQGLANDFMLIEYREGDKLYLPVDRLNLVSRYEGLSDKQPKIDKLGAQSWKATKQKVSEEVWKVAQELLDIYAHREIRNGRSFSPPSELYQELEESFPYDETPGQYRAITETIDDLTSERPMDRLICGDVGYGKTEVAIRAAFKVIEDGFQVALLVPTTVLAEQHVKTFKERLQGFPVRVESINRFKSHAEQKRLVSDLSGGSIDVIIGTHRLLSKDISFKQLGLLIVDEEHRFGVSHKEKIKQLKAEVDILTLTATPIPRTLQMSLLGIRDLSVISSPPEHRRPVKTFVSRYDELVIKEAVSREIARGGQVFIVHNRVKSIHRMAATIQELIPAARIAVAHGQMVGKELEQIMVSFVNHHLDVLVSTTIIESGLDIPTANTIIINRADRLGLAEIYQLRGRVGRSSTQSFAYLLVPSIDHLSKDSRERLRALMEYNELGGGFKLAMSDLQIRGGGNLLGVSQSGHIAAIGYDLYLDLLQKTVAELKSRADDPDRIFPAEDIDPEINLRVSAYIPKTYIADISQRYIMYRRIAALSKSDSASFQDLLDELSERYGAPPEELNNLFSVVAIKKELIPLRVNKLERGPDNLVFSFLPDTPVDPAHLTQYLQKTGGAPRLTPDGRLVIKSMAQSMPDISSAVKTALKDLHQLSHERTIH
jgi:transcription-repair coupling factor (superfamily II helicase)